MKPNRLIPRLLLSIAIIRVLYAWYYDPFGADELAITLGLLNRGLLSIHPFQPETHSLSALLSWIFLKLFANDSGNARLVGAVPSVMFSLCFLVCLFRVGSQRLSPWGNSFLLLAFAANAFFIRYSHSLKGYSLMLLAGLGLTVLPLRLLEKSNRKIEILLGVILAFGPLVQSFLGMLGIAAVLAWTFLTSLSPDSSRRCHVLTKRAALCLIPCVILLVGQGMCLYHRQELGSGFGGRYPPFELLPHLFGISGVLWNWPVLLLCLAVALGLRRFTFQTALLFSFSLCFGAAYVLFRPSFLAARFFLGALPLFLFWLLQSLEGIEPSIIRWGHAFLYLAIFGVAPLVTSNRWRAGEGETHLASLTNFAERVRKNVGKINSACVEFSGLPNKVVFVKGLYLDSSVKSTCPKNYRIALAPSSKSFPSFDDWASYQEILSDSEGNRLYRKVESPSEK